MSDKLLPCPFCGGEARVIDDVPSHDHTPWFGIGCASPYCIAFTGYGVKLFDTKAEAIAAWNRRAKPSQPTHRDELSDYLCDMCANDCDERKVIRVGQGAYDVCERWKEGRP